MPPLIDYMKQHKIKTANGCRVFTLVTVIAALFGFMLHILLCIFTDVNPLYSAMGIGIAYVVIIASAAIISRLVTPRAVIDEKLTPLLGQLMVDVILKLYIPVLICDENGKIIWYNRALSTHTVQSETLYGLSTEQVCSITPEMLTASEGIDEVMLGERLFSVVSYEIKAVDKNYRLLIFSDLTEMHSVKQRLYDEDTVIMYIMIDNLDELLQYVQDKYRTASSEILEILKKWAISVGGVIKEYERDKYILIMKRKSLSEEIERRFSILDEIRNVRIGDGSIPVTVSIGVSDISGSLSEKERVAQSALDMSLQRGGDQVVLKREDSIDFYGGRTRTVQKRAKVRARVIANELVMHMSTADNILIMGHRYADFDSFGGCVGISRLADFCGVGVNIVVDTDDDNVKRCMAKFAALPQYKGRFVDAQTGLDMLRTGTMLVIVDVNNFEHLESPEIAAHVEKIAIIDHHRKTAEFLREPQITYIEPSASSVCELVSEILEQSLPMGLLFKEEADMLFAGMLLDTKQFSRNTGTRTFSAAQYLRGEGAAPSDAQELFRTNLDDFIREAKFETDVVIYRGVVAIARSDSEGVPQDRIAAAKAADKLLGISGILASFALVKIGSAVHISARSTGSINVQLILESLSGGGHYDVAGAQVEHRTVLEALTQLKGAIDKYLDS